MRKLFTCCSFAMVALIVMAVFITATTYLQLALAIILYPLLICFAFKAFPRKTQNTVSKSPEILQSVEESPEENHQTPKMGSFGITDIDKRVFLSLIGGAGLTLFLFSIFNRRAEGLFFKSQPAIGSSVSLEDTAGKKIDPAQNQPTDGYRISEIDENVVTFYGFTNKDGAWFVMKEDTETGSFRYTKGDSNFPSNWNNREKLSYDYFNNVF